MPKKHLGQEEYSKEQHFHDSQNRVGNFHLAGKMLSENRFPIHLNLSMGGEVQVQMHRERLGSEPVSKFEWDSVEFGLGVVEIATKIVVVVAEKEFDEMQSVMEGQKLRHYRRNQDQSHLHHVQIELLGNSGLKIAPDVKDWKGEVDYGRSFCVQESGLQ